MGSKGIQANLSKGIYNMLQSGRGQDNEFSLILCMHVKLLRYVLFVMHHVMAEIFLLQTSIYSIIHQKNIMEITKIITLMDWMMWMVCKIYYNNIINIDVDREISA